MLIKNILKFPYLKLKYKGLLKFDITTDISKSSTFEGMNKIHHHSYFSGYMGYGSYLGDNCHLNAKIGKFTSIAQNVRCNIGIHPYNVFVSTSPVFYSKSKSKNGNTFTKIDRFNELRFADKINKFGVIIGSDCWIGEGVFFSGGISVGDGAVILAHAVIVKDVPPFAIVGGVPSKIIKYRFDEKTINFLLKFKWWEKDPEWLKNNVDKMENVETFIENYNKG